MGLALSNLTEPLELFASWASPQITLFSGDNARDREPSRSAYSFSGRTVG